MSDFTFKVTIPLGGQLEKELQGKKGRERTMHLYMLGELGARTLQNITRTENTKSNGIEVGNEKDTPCESLTAKESNPITSGASVVFNVSDLLSV